MMKYNKRRKHRIRCAINDMRPLLMAAMGMEVVVEKCMLSGNLKRHVDSLGILPGEKITPIASNDGNLILKVKESRFAINTGVASKIYVN